MSLSPSPSRKIVRGSSKLRHDKLYRRMKETGWKPQFLRVIEFPLECFACELLLVYTFITKILCLIFFCLLSIIDDSGEFLIDHTIMLVDDQNVRFKIVKTSTKWIWSLRKFVSNPTAFDNRRDLPRPPWSEERATTKAPFSRIEFVRRHAIEALTFHEELLGFRHGMNNYKTPSVFIFVKNDLSSLSIPSWRKRYDPCLRIYVWIILTLRWAIRRMLQRVTILSSIKWAAWKKKRRTNARKHRWFTKKKADSFMR